jgi:hypothetical protein
MELCDIVPNLQNTHPSHLPSLGLGLGLAQVTETETEMVMVKEMDHLLNTKPNQTHHSRRLID